MKLNVRLLCRTALLLALCIASQFLKNVSPYITGSIVNAVLILATLSCGFFSGAAISLIAPLTAWWITGSPLISAIPLLLPCIMLGNLMLVAFVWLFVSKLGQRAGKAERLEFSDDRFRLVLTVAAVTSALWASLCIAFLSSLADLFQVESAASLLITVLISIAGTFLLFACLWLLISRFPSVWSPIAGMVFGAVFKTVIMWLTIVKGVLPAYGPTSGLPEKVLASAPAAYSVTQLLTALLGSALAFLIWLPLQKFLGKKKG